MTYEKTINEPAVHPLVKNSFVFVQSAGMRLAPEVLLLELFREIYFDRRYGSTSGTKYLIANEMGSMRDSFFYSKEERAILFMMRGRRKKSKTC